jgi:hypothetical protein
LINGLFSDFKRTCTYPLLYIFIFILYFLYIIYIFIYILFFIYYLYIFFIYLYTAYIYCIYFFFLYLLGFFSSHTRLQLFLLFVLLLLHFCLILLTSRSYSPRVPSRRLPSSSGHNKLSAQAAANQANLAAAAAAAISKKGAPLPKPAKTIAVSSFCGII